MRCKGTELETESRDRTDLELPGNQLQLLKDAIFYSKAVICGVLIMRRIMFGKSLSSDRSNTRLGTLREGINRMYRILN